MNATPEPHPRDDAKRRGEAVVSDWLDGPRGPAALAAAAERFEALDEPARRRAADALLIASLARRALRPDPAADERRIARAMAAIRANVALASAAPDRAAASLAPVASATSPPVAVPAPSVASPRRATRATRGWLVLLATAALVLLSVYVNRHPPAATAQAAVRRATEAAERSLDHRYLVHATLTGPLQDWTWDARLDLRGANQFVLAGRGPAGEFLVGSDGREHWFVPALSLAPVRAGRDKGRLAAWLREGGSPDVAQPFLDLRSLLARLESRYTLTLADAEPLPNAPPRPRGALADGNATWTRVRGEAKDDPGPWPDTVELWCDPQTGQAVRTTLAWRDRGLVPRLRELTLQLDAPVVWPPDWFTHAAHHAPDRPVSRAD